MGRVRVRRASRLCADIDLDQQAIESALSDAPSGYATAKNIYQLGGHSKPTAECTLTSPATLGQAVANVLNMALDVEEPGGDGEGWLQVANGLGFERTEAQYRKIAASSTGQTRGAAADEVDRALEVVCDQAKEALDAIDPPLSGPTGRRGHRPGNQRTRGTSAKITAILLQE